MQNKETHYLINGQWANGISKEDQELLELIPDYIAINSKAFFKEHQIKLLDATTYEDDPSQESALWTLHFQAHDIGVSEIDDFFLRPILLAWDMNGIDQVFETISLNHHRKSHEEDLPDDLYITIRCFC